MKITRKKGNREKKLKCAHGLAHTCAGGVPCQPSRIIGITTYSLRSKINIYDLI
jgi:hypothetical protein